MTNAEKALWLRLRRKQMQGIQFYRQKPLGNYIVDFYAPRAGIVIEVDGAQHRESVHEAFDKQRDAYLAQLGLRVLRFDNLQVLREIDAVLEAIHSSIGETAART
jgi:very-short-patch-repair endonuclease